MNYPFELHLTVAHDGTLDFHERFSRVCDAIGVKPLIVDLAGAGLDVMTSSTIEGLYIDAMFEVSAVRDALTKSGFVVTRVKVETVPWMPSADCPSPAQYFETHLAVTVPDGMEDDLRFISNTNGCHTSKNAFKVYPNYKVIMVTKRDCGCSSADFIKEADRVRQILTDADFKVDKPIVEFVIYDSNQAHDNAWLTQARQTVE